MVCVVDKGSGYVCGIKECFELLFIWIFKFKLSQSILFETDL